MAQGWRALVADVRAGLYSSRVFCHKAERTGSLRFVPFSLRTPHRRAELGSSSLERSRDLLQQFACTLADERSLVFGETITVQHERVETSKHPADPVKGLEGDYSEACGLDLRRVFVIFPRQHGNFPGFHVLHFR